MKPSSMICFLFFLAGILLWLAQLWFGLWSPETFSKIIATDIALFAVSFVFFFLVKENKASEKIHHKNSLD